MLLDFSDFLLDFLDLIVAFGDFGFQDALSVQNDMAELDQIDGLLIGALLEELLQHILIIGFSGLVKIDGGGR